MRRVLPIVILVMFTGCALLKHEAEKLAEERAEKVFRDIAQDEFNKYFDAKLRDSIGNFIVDTGPYSLSGLLLLLAGKWGIELKKRKNGNEKS